MDLKTALKSCIDLAANGGGEITIPGPDYFTNQCFMHAVSLLSATRLAWTPRTSVVLHIPEGQPKHMPNWLGVEQPTRADGRRGAPKSARRIELEALQPGDTKSFPIETPSDAQTVRTTITAIQRQTGHQYKSNYDPSTRSITVTCLDRDQDAPRRQRSSMSLSGMRVGQIVFIEDTTLAKVKRACAAHQKPGTRLQAQESTYDYAIEVCCLPDTARVPRAISESIANARIQRVFEQEGVEFIYRESDGSAKSYPAGSIALDGHEFFSGQLDDVLQLLQPGETALFGGIPESKLKAAAEFWRKERNLKAIRVNGYKVTAE